MNFFLKLKSRNVYKQNNIQQDRKSISYTNKHPHIFIRSDIRIFHGSKPIYTDYNCNILVRYILPWPPFFSQISQSENLAFSHHHHHYYCHTPFVCKKKWKNPTRFFLYQVFSAKFSWKKICYTSQSISNKS